MITLILAWVTIPAAIVALIYVSRRGEVGKDTPENVDQLARPDWSERIALGALASGGNVETHDSEVARG